jgi:(1->4)-alpha-D-glucan 1-alpha-D-glucosylmutase
LRADGGTRTKSRRRPHKQRIALQSSNPAIPRATYRLQLHAGFTFRDATAIVPYLARLGVSHVYCSPFLRARPGSMHGYDVIDHTAFNPEIGTREDFDRFVAALRAHGMGQIADIVPNHMGVLGGDNAWWLDVLENGPASRYADFFDIDWMPARADLANRVLLPVLGEQYGLVLERGELQLAFVRGRGAFELGYFDHRFPIDPREYPRIISEALNGNDDAQLAGDALHALQELSERFRSLPDRSEHSPQRREPRDAAKAQRMLELAALVRTYPAIARAIDRAVAAFNGTAGIPESFDKLDRLIDAQAYRLAYWRVASSEINYRRFFNINELAAIRVENETVFDATHALIMELLAARSISGLRIDHPDGLQDPAAYFERLQSRYAERMSATAAPSKHGADPLYVVIEKIIAPFERVVESWPVYGTTGYRFAAVVNGLFVDTAAQRRLTRTYASFIADPTSFAALVRRSKRLILRTELAAELGVLTHQLARIARADRKTRDHTYDALRQALIEAIAFFPVYRTYIADKVGAVDKRYIDWALAQARAHSREADKTIFEFVHAALLGELPLRSTAEGVRLLKAFVLRFQQLTAPVMAKAVEDTSFYNYNRLVSLNDVGGEPGTFGMGVRAFHGASQDRARTWPHTLLATSTHDNKRSEDVRTRIDVLSEVPAAWRLWLRRWSRLNRSRKHIVRDSPAPSLNDEYLLYQILLGSLPSGSLHEAGLAAYASRIEAYMIKAAREAKAHTSWINVDEEYEAALKSFVGALLGAGHNPFLESLQAAAAPIAWIGMLNSLAMVLVKLTSPGVPDIYQGNELWDYSLVDPDNRRPVDYALRVRLLDELEQSLSVPRDRLPARISALFDAPEDGRPKLFVTQRLLALRRAHAELFKLGGYTALNAAGSRAQHVVGYARRHAGRGIVAIAGRLYARLIESRRELPCGERVWQDTTLAVPFLAEGTILTDALSGAKLRVTDGCVRLAEAWSCFPGAVLQFES